MDFNNDNNLDIVTKELINNEAIIIAIVTTKEKGIAQAGAFIETIATFSAQWTYEPFSVNPTIKCTTNMS